MTKKHTYGLVHRTSRYFFLTMSIASVAIGTFFLYAAIGYFFSGRAVTLSYILFIVCISFACIVWSPVAFVFIAYTSTDVDVDEKGLSFQFLWTRFSVGWKEIAVIKHIRPFGLFTNRYSHIIVVSSKLTFIHRIYGLIYGGAYRPSILIHKNISGYELLIENISQRIKKNHK